MSLMILKSDGSVTFAFCDDFDETAWFAAVWAHGFVL